MSNTSACITTSHTDDIGTARTVRLCRSPHKPQVYSVQIETKSAEADEPLITEFCLSIRALHMLTALLSDVHALEDFAIEEQAK